jgi:hypothetical protein
MFCHFFNAKGAKFAKKKEIFAVLAGFAERSLPLRKPRHTTVGILKIPTPKSPM